MRSGSWFFVYTDYDAMESMGNEIEDVEVPLKAMSEAEAIAEGKVIWEVRYKLAVEWWEKQKKEWMHPPKAPFHGVEPRPRVIYKFYLSDDE